MKHLTVGIFGDNELVKKLGKKGTSNDIELYNHGSSEGVFTYACINSEKIQPLLQLLGMIDVPVVVVKELTKEMGEIIIAVDNKGFDKGFLMTNNPDSIKGFIKGTNLENFVIIEDDASAIRQELVKFEIQRDDDKDVIVPIDNSFSVKSIGTVVLGVVKQGKLKKHDKLMLEPLGKEVLIKSMQSQDRDVEEATSGTRVGAAIKGVETDEIKRGYIICKSSKKGKSFEINFEKSKYNKEEIKPGIQIFVSTGVQVSVAKIDNIKGTELKVTTEHELAYNSGDSCIMASTRNILPRIIGKGRIL